MRESGMFKNNISIKTLPFYWRVRNNVRDGNIVTDFLPFVSSYDPHFRLIIQKRCGIVLKSLDTIYKESPNIGNIQENGFGSDSYKSDFLRFILKNTSRRHEGSNALEIGCGGCLMLKTLKHNGFDVLGVDPSPFSIEYGKKIGIDVIQDFFPTPKIKDTFDLIYHSDVIEHMERPVTFLRRIYRHLRDSGTLIIATPDCERSIDNGDISMLLHQHLNYFDSESLRNIIKAAGFVSIVIEKAKYGGSLYSRAIKKKNHRLSRITSFDTNKYKYHSFISNANRMVANMKNEIDAILSDKNRSVGFYAPIRALPYLGSWGIWKGFRFFDDSPLLHRKFFDGIDIPIENFQDLKKRPVTDMFIMSPSFGDIIERRIISSLGRKIRVKKLTDYFRV